MADSAVPEETPTQRQARIRREKREKKILAGGSERLAKITGVSGRTADLASTPSASPRTTAPSVTPPPSLPAPDPPSPVLNPSTSNSASQFNNSPAFSEADLRAFLRNAAPEPGARPLNGNGSPAQPDQPPDLMAIFQQMMGGNGSPPGPGGMPSNAAGMGLPRGDQQQAEMSGLPPALASLLTGGGAPAPSQPAAVSAYIWKILHAACAFFLAGYILYMYPFVGTLAARSPDPTSFSSIPEDVAGVATKGASGIFYIFATIQLVLQSTRFVLEKGQGEAGMLAKVAGFLPPPWGDRLRLVGRYSGIWTTLVADAMCVVFVLGAVAWWRGVGA